MSESKPVFEPYIPASKNIAESTVLSIGLGLFLAVVMGAANTYAGLYAGMTVSASIPAAVISMAILRGVFRRGTILENNIAQTVASTGEGLAAGAIFIIPALVMIGAWTEFEFWPTTMIVMLGGLLGIVFMVPLRKALIVDNEDLIYPEGVACSEVLIVGQEGGTGIKWIGIGLGIGMIFKYLVSGLALIKGTVEGAFALGSKVVYGGSDMSVMLVAVGYIVRLNIAAQVFAGGVIGWFIAIPLLGGYGGEGTSLDFAWDLWSTKVRYIGVGTMLVGGLASIWSVRHGITQGLKAMRGPSRSAETADATLRTDRNMALTPLVSIFLFAALGTFMLYDVLIGSVFVAFIAAIVMIVASFIFVAVATYIVGLVGSSNSPVSGMTICALLLTAGVLLALGIESESAILATLGVAGVVCCATCTAGDVAQDLKTGVLVGATPAKQQWAEILGVVVTAFIFAPVMTWLHAKYVIGEGLRAPQAALFASLTNGIFGDGSIPKNMIYIGVGIGIAIIALDKFLNVQGFKARLHVMPIAVGIYLPVSIAVPIFLGGLISYIVHRGSEEEQDDAGDRGVLFGSGLVAGEAFMGIGLAIPIEEIGYEYFALDEGSTVVSLLLFTAVVATYYLISRKTQPT